MTFRGTYRVEMALLNVLLSILWVIFSSTISSADSMDISRPVEPGNKFPAKGQRVRIDYDTTITKRILYAIPYSEKKTLKAFGNLISYSSDSIVIDSDEGATQKHSISVSSVRRVFIANGHIHATLEGMKIGALLGAIAFAPTAHGSNTEPGTEYSNNWDNRLTVFAGSIVIGGVIGWLIKEERWKQVNKSAWLASFDVLISDRDVRLRMSYGF